MTRRALAVVERRVVVRDQLDDPRHLIGVDVEQRRVGIERRAAPLRAAVESRKHDRALERRRREEALLILLETREHVRVRLGRARRQHVFGQALARERHRQRRIRLLGRHFLAVDRGRRHLAHLDRKQRRARVAIEHVRVAVLRDLRDGVDRAAIAAHGHQIRRRGEIPVPDVVPDALEVPDVLARPRVEREHAVGEEVVAVTSDAVEIERRRSRRGKDQAVLHVNGHARPRVGAARELVRVRRPRVVAHLARPRNRVEDPPHLARVHVERADVSGRSGQRLRHRGADDDHVLEDRAGRARADAQSLGRLIEAFAQIDPAVRAERRESAGRSCGRARRGMTDTSRTRGPDRRSRRDAAPARSRSRRRSDRTSRSPRRSPRRPPPPSSTASSHTARHRRRSDCSASRTHGTSRASRTSRRPAGWLTLSRLICVSGE